MHVEDMYFKSLPFHRSRRPNGEIMHMMHARPAACDLDRSAVIWHANAVKMKALMNLSPMSYILFLSLMGVFGVKRAIIDISYHLHLCVFTIKSAYIRFKLDFHIKTVYQIPTL